MVYVIEPKNEKVRRRYIKKAVSHMLRRFKADGVTMDQSTLKLIIREGYDFWPELGDDGLIYAWKMTVALKGYEEDDG